VRYAKTIGENIFYLPARIGQIAFRVSTCNRSVDFFAVTRGKPLWYEMTARTSSTWQKRSHWRIRASIPLFWPNVQNKIIKIVGSLTIWILARVAFIKQLIWLDISVFHAIWHVERVTNHGPLQLRTKHGGDNARSPWRNGFWAKYFSRFKRGCKMRPTCKIRAQLLHPAKSYGLPKLTTYTVVKSQFLGLQLSRQILFVQI
jgi:hypothetical protein